MLIRSLLLILMFIGFIGCMKATYKPTSTLTAIKNEDMLLGEITYDDILYYFPRWKAQDAEVAVNAAHVAQLKEITRQLNILCYLGTWCGDSRDGVPPFVQALVAAENPNLKIELLGVNRDKQDSELTAILNDIQRVPTFIILENDVEIGRLVEFPQKNDFVEDFLDVVNAE